MADTDLTEAYRLGTEAMHKLRYQDGPDGCPMLVMGSNEDCARTVVDAVGELLVEQGRKLGYDQAAEDMTPLAQSGYAAGKVDGRQQAADAILAHANRYAPEPSALRRALHIAARVATSPPTMQEVADAIGAGDAIVCRLNDDGTPAGGGQ